MARYIDADELLSKLNEYLSNLEADKAMLNSDRMAMTCAVEECIAIVEDMPTADAVPTDYHDRCMELEINRRFAAEARARVYPHVLNAVHEELANAIGLVERMQKANDKKDE